MPSSSKAEEVCHVSPKKKRIMTLVICLLSSVESSGVVMADLLEKKRSALQVLRLKGV